ncbi:MAG: hypothetical protein U5K37_11185 [Natrialbaceae archaeon]|nr:hypothetical protein [Natrialbaceae archaeon]
MCSHRRSSRSPTSDPGWRGPCVLELYGLGREYFKTLYFEWELVSLWRSMMYLAVPALVVSISTTLFFSPSVTTMSLAGIHGTEFIIIGAVLVVLVPVMHLFSYILRIATMAKGTLAIGPFVRSPRRD